MLITDQKDETKAIKDIVEITEIIKNAKQVVNTKKTVSDAVDNSDAIRPKRVRERSIVEIIKAVAIWRRLYSGVLRNNGEVMIRYTLEDAAKKVGMSKKTLDDYLYLLRMGRKYGFPFKARWNDMTG